MDATLKTHLKESDKRMEQKPTIPKDQTKWKQSNWESAQRLNALSLDAAYPDLYKIVGKIEKISKLLEGEEPEPSPDIS